MNAVDSAIQDAMYRLPRELLQYAFINQAENAFIKFPVSIEHAIKDKVFDRKVIPDCDLVGGIQDTIELKNLQPQYRDNDFVVYKVPKTMTQGRTITSVLAVELGGVYGKAMGTSGHASSSSNYLTAGRQLLNANSVVSPNISINADVIGENIVTISPSDLYTNHSLRVMLSNSENMANLKPKTIPLFRKLALHAIKGYIWANAVLPLDKGRLLGGKTLGELKGIVDSYQDEMDLYDAELVRWQKIASFDDKQSRVRAARRTAR